MSNLYKKTFRGYLIDHHSPDHPIVTLDKLDPEEYRRFFKEANINNLMLYCKDHWGVTYYDTKVGKRHPGLKQDWIASLLPVLREMNIEFNAYYCLEYDSYAPVLHPEWSTRKPDGTPLHLTGRIPKWGMPCYETGYRQYVLEQLREIVSGYSPDSIFLDIFGKSLCYCDSCKAKFKNIYGYDLPEDPGSDINVFLDNCAKEMLSDIIETVKSIDPDIKVTINFAALYPKNVRDILDYQFTEPWAGNWLSAAYSRDTAKGQYPQLGPGDVSEVYNYQHENIYILAAAQIAAQGCRVFMYSGSQHVDGTLEHEEAARIGAAYREVERFEEYLDDREVIADIGIIQSDASSLLRNSTGVVVNAIERSKQGSEHRSALLGAMKLCDASKLTWCIIPEQELDLKTAEGFKLLIFPGVFHITDDLRSVLESYVSKGGIITASDESGSYDSSGFVLENFSTAVLYGCDFIEKELRFKNNPWGSYLQLKSDYWTGSPDTYPPVSETHQRIKAVTCDTLAHFVEPATAVTDDNWVNWWSPPPSKVTIDPAITLNHYGKGKVIFAAFDMFRMQNKGFNLIKDIFSKILNNSIKAPSIELETEYPGTVNYVCYDRKVKKEIVVHQLCDLAEKTGGDAPYVSGGMLRISKAYKNSLLSARLVYPEVIALDICSGGEECYHIKLPDFNIHQVISIKYS